MLKNVLKNLNESDKVIFSFRSASMLQSGEYVFLGSKTGRGKGGSIIAEFSPIGEDSVVTVGTKQSDQVVHVIVDGNFSGFESESDMPVSYETDAGAALTLKSQFRAFLQEKYCPREVRVSSCIPKMNGTFTVTSAKQLRGRVGQIVLQTQEGVEFCSYNHSGIINTFWEPVDNTVEQQSPVAELSE